MILLLVTKVLGFIKIRIIAQLFGVSRELDLFWAAFAVPDTIFNVLVAGAINAAIIPVFTDVLHVNGKTPLKDLFKKLAFIYISFFVVASILMFIFAPQIGQSLIKSEGLHALLGTSSTITQEDVSLFVKLMRIMLLSPLFLGLSSFVTAFLQTNKKFFVAALSPLFYNIAMIVAALVMVKWFDMNVYGISWAVVLGSAAHLFVQIPEFIKEYGSSVKGIFGRAKIFVKSLWSRDILRVFKLALPRVAGLFGEQVNVIINTIISFTLSAGALSAYKFAFSLHLFPVQVFGGAISQVALPNMSEYYAKKDNVRFKETFNKAIQQSLFLILPVVAILLVLRLPLVRLAYGVGEFDWWATVITSWCLALLSVAIVGQAVVLVVLRAFYAIHETKLPLIATVVAIVVNIVGSYYLTNFFSHYYDWRPILNQIFVQIKDLNGGGLFEVVKSFFTDFATWSTTRNVSDAAVGGLALATSLAFIAEMFVALFLLDKKIKVISMKETVMPALKKLLNVALMTFGMYYVFKLFDFSLDTSRTVQVLILTVCTSVYGIVSYLVGCKVLGISEADLMYNRVKEFTAPVLSKFMGGRKGGNK